MTDFIDVTENHIILGDNLEALGKIPDESIQMIYIDPPFNTGKVQKLTTKTMVESTSGDRTGFGGKRYKTVDGKTISYADTFTDFIEFLAPRLEEAHRILKDTGTIYIHLDYREVHYVKVYMDTLFGRDSFLNEIIWAYDYGAKSKRKWPAKHDNILVYVKNPKTYFFDSIEVDREPYMAPGLVSKEKAEKGKLPTTVWWHTIVPTNSKERTGYPTQKPEGIVRRMVTASSRPGDTVLDFFAGSGTLGAVAKSLGRTYILVDESAQAYDVMTERLP